MHKKTANERLGIPKGPSKRWEWIKYQLKLKRTSLTDLGSSLGVTRQAISHVKTRHHPEFEKIIAQTIEVLPEQIWPDRYSKYMDEEDESNKSDLKRGDQA